MGEKKADPRTILTLLSFAASALFGFFLYATSSSWERVERDTREHDTRITRLEAQTEESQRRFDRLEGKVDRVLELLQGK